MTINKRPLLVVANWKMNGSLRMIRPLLTKIVKELSNSNTEVVICPPFVYLPTVQEILHENIHLGAQDVSCFDNGAYTGDISAQMLVDYKCSYVIVGHSERRTGHVEKNKYVADKFAAVCSQNMSPILCVGESDREHELNITEDIIAQQLDAVVEKVGILAFKKSVIAYEPIWAIGTGRAATPTKVQSVHEFIRSYLSKYNKKISDDIRILYGGSVKAKNAKSIFAMNDIDGGLIGGASLEAKEFINICQS